MTDWLARHRAGETERGGMRRNGNRRFAELPGKSEGKTRLGSSVPIRSASPEIESRIGIEPNAVSFGGAANLSEFSGAPVSL